MHQAHESSPPYRRALSPWADVGRVIKRWIESRPRLLVLALPLVNVLLACLIAQMLPISTTDASYQQDYQPITQRGAANELLLAIAQQHNARRRLSRSVITLPGDDPAIARGRHEEVVFIPTVVIDEAAANARAAGVLAALDDDSPLDAHPPYKPLRVAYVVDISGSLVDSLADVVDWLGDAMDRLTQPVYFTVIFFRSHEVIEAPPVGLKTGTFHTKAMVYNWMQLDTGNIEPLGTSDVADALDAALRYDVDDVYIVSDDGFGVGSTWTLDPELLVRIGETLGDRELRIHTVQFYYRDKAGALEAIADRFDGDYTFIDPPRQRPRFVIDLYGEMAWTQSNNAPRF